MDIKGFTIENGGANCYLVKMASACAVVDPFAADRRIKEFFEEDPELDRYVLLTHCHFDHILGAKELKDSFGAKIVIGRLDEAGLSDPSISLSAWVGLTQEPFSADITVQDGDIIDLGGTAFTVIHTPGHTAGSVCFAADGIMFTGDTLFKRSIGRTDFPTGDTAALYASLKKLAGMEEHILYPGHGPDTTLYDEIKNNPYMKDI